MDKSSNKDKVRQVFTNYMTANGLRKTPERYAVLDAAYSETERFNINEISTSLEKRNFHVSNATIYKTLELLQSAGLVLKLQLGNAAMIYEPCFEEKAHCYKICRNCGMINPFEANELSLSIRTYKLNHFRTDDFSLCLYGTCSKCAAALGRKLKQRKAKTTNNK